MPYTLTKRQRDMIPDYTAKWVRIGLSTQPGDRQRAESLLAEIYRLGGLAPPARYIWLPSPLHGVSACLLLDAREQVWAQVGAPVWEQVGAQARAQVWAQVWAQVGKQVGAPVWAQVGKQVRAPVWEQVGEQVRAQVGEQVWERIRNNACWGAFDCEWLSFYDFLRSTCGIDCIEPLVPLMDLSHEVGWWWPYTKVCIVTEKPTTIARDEQGRLHSATGPALDYGGTWGVWAWHGVRVEPGIIQGNYTAQDCLAESNLERQRVMIERMGADRFFREVKGKVVYQDRDGHGNQRCLVHIPLAGATAGFLAAVHVICPTTGREYYLSVPATVRTCQEAVASTFGLRPEQYAPEIES